MNSDADRAARMQKEALEQPSSKPSDSRSDSLREVHLRQIPSVDELLSRPRLRSLCETAGRALVTEATRTVLADIRSYLLRETPAARPEALQSPASANSGQAATPTADALEIRIAEEVRNWLAPSLRRAINATGVILHTNLGRAPISIAAMAAFEETATRYSNLEYDIATGQRGKRDVHTSRLLISLTGAEAAIVVNNNAAAVFLILNTLAKGAEVVVSRGELIEIGDGFRIPDIMSESGAVLHEVGTTNRTRIRDYERAINERTRLLLRVHPSNFRITGFTERPSLEELVLLGQRSQIPVYEDLGSGCLADLSASGICEPLVRASCEAGASVVSFSGDKLLGGPQAGIIAGKKEIVERIRRNPLFRALRVDKLSVAALEATLKAYYRGALDEVPALRMIRASREEIDRRASQFAEHLRAAVPADILIELTEGFSVIGGGSTPDQQLPTTLLALRSSRHSPSALDELLRNPAHGIPVIARVADDRLTLDLRTVFADEEPALSAALVSALV
ncbi:MAG TPA: L-seryl-tRNA(Sec) selenium transferase [Candidatus Acidoferrales bacterium]|nr:L-seryl-tRNA(Sec) selenium transferase [Candidatus Acidoferrales bacterium]